MSGCNNLRGASDGMNHSRRQILGLCAAMLTAPLRSLGAEPALGVILPRKDAVPAEALTMYPTGVRFLTEGFSTADDGPLIGTLATYEKFKDRLAPAAEALHKQGAQAILVLGTSVTFYRGAAYNQSIADSIHRATGLPATTMSSAIVEGLHAVGARRLAVATGYIDEVNEQFRVFLQQSGFEVLVLKGLGCSHLQLRALRIWGTSLRVFTIWRRKRTA